MSPTALVIVLAVALGGLTVALNHCHARLALVELALNEGLPPGYQTSTVPVTSSSRHQSSGQSSADITELLGSGVHVFLSRTCHACQRLIDEFDQTVIRLDADIHLRYVDRPRPIATSAADQAGAELHVHQGELAGRVGADPLPFTVAVGAHGLVAHAVTPTIGQVVVAARDAGISMDTVGAR